MKQFSAKKQTAKDSILRKGAEEDLNVFQYSHQGILIRKGALISEI